MKKYIKYFGMIVFSTVLVGLHSCSEDEGVSIDNNADTLLQVAKRSTALTSFLAAIETSGSDLGTILSGGDNTTVFAPSNAAFNALFEQLKAKGFESLADFDTADEKALLANLLKYHTVSGFNNSNSFQDGQVLSTLEGNDVSLIVGDEIMIQDVTGGTALQKTSKVEAADLTAKNGVIHFIDGVLFSQELIDGLDIQPTITQTVVFEEGLSQLELAVTKAGLGETLSGEGPFTVFAPADDAFSDLFDALGDDYTSFEDFDNSVETDLLTNILLYHVVPGQVGSTDLVVGNVETSFGENELEVIAGGSGFVLRDESGINANITALDISSSNGVSHVIDKVLLPQAAFDFIDLLASDNIVELASDTPDLSILADAVVKTDLVAILSGLNTKLDEEGNVVDADPNFTYYNTATVFAPNNVAFNALFARLNEALGTNYTGIADFVTDEEIALLKDILLYHVFSGEVKAADLKEGAVTTLKGEDIEIIQRIGNGFVIGDASNDINAEILTTDVDAKNGVVHVIDKVLLPIEIAASLKK